jgi:hypothetical protein
MDWEFEPHTTLLKKERREGVVGRRRRAKIAEEKGESLEFKEELEKQVFWSQEMVDKVMIQADK